MEEPAPMDASLVGDEKVAAEAGVDGGRRTPEESETKPESEAEMEAEAHIAVAADMAAGARTGVDNGLGIVPEAEIGELEIGFGTELGAGLVAGLAFVSVVAAAAVAAAAIGVRSPLNIQKVAEC
jgi:hypothetical protein